MKYYIGKRRVKKLAYCRWISRARKLKGSEFNAYIKSGQYFVTFDFNEAKE